VKKQILVVGLALLAFVFALAASVQSSYKVSELYVFGDSLSDIGNVFRATGGTYPSSPPYYQGHYSNGPVWVEYLASKLAVSTGQTTNFAYGGATTGSSANGVPGLLTQIDSFTKVHTKANPNALYTLWAGANDYLNGSTVPTSVKNLTGAIESLTTAGAKKILIANLPDLGKLPATRNSTLSDALSSLTQAHNRDLAASVNELKPKLGPDVQIIMLDVYSMYQDAIANPAKFGFKNVTSSCLANSVVCSSPSEFLFWDEIHPTTATHQALGERAFSVVQPVLSSNTRPGFLHLSQSN
jgi:thermolabile hemolysin